MMADGLTAGLSKALVIARTEQIRVFRQATQDQYKETGFIEQWQRHAIPQERTCIACLALDGKISDVNTDIESHPQCRCFYTPIIPGFTAPDSTSGETWLDKQSEQTQRNILGDARYQMWKDGTPLTDFVKVAQDKTWGPTIGIKPLGEMGKASSGKILPIPQALGADVSKHAVLRALRVNQLSEMGKDGLEKTIEKILAPTRIPEEKYHFEKWGKQAGFKNFDEYQNSFEKHLQNENLRFFTGIGDKDHRMWYILDMNSGFGSVYDETNGEHFTYMYHSKPGAYQKFVNNSPWLVEIDPKSKKVLP